MRRAQNYMSSRRTGAVNTGSQARPSAGGQYAQAIQPTIEVNTSEVQAFGSVSQVGGSSTLNFISLTLENSSSADQTFIIGDPSGIVEGAAAPGAAYLKPVSNTIPYPAVLQSFVGSGLSIKMINYQVTNSATQFNKKFRHAFADVDGTLNLKPIGVGLAKRNNQYDPKLLSLQFSRLILDQLHALLLVVGGNETVVLEMEVGAALNRRQ